MASYFLMFIDSQLALLITHLLPDNLQISSYTLFVLIVCFLKDAEEELPATIFFLIGLGYDIYFLNVLGFATMIFPILAMMMRSILHNNRFHFLTFLLIIIVMIFSFELALLLFSYGFGLVSYSLPYFIVTFLVPTLLINFLFVILLYPIIKRLFLRNRHLIVTNL